MPIASFAGRLSIAVSLLLTALAVLLLYPMREQTQERQRKPDQAAARAAAQASPVRTSSSPFRTVHLRLPPPPAARPAQPVSAPAPKPAPRVVRARWMVTPLRPSKPAPKAEPRKQIPKRRPPPIAAQKTPPATPLARPKKTFEAASEPRGRKFGRALLRLLEHGKGPTVEIAWPEAAADRVRLYRRLKRCYGMRIAVLDGGDRLFAEGGAAGAPWRMDLDRFSGFLRSPAGQTIPEESRLFAAVAARHRLADWRPVRVFPRKVDAVLLGGLQRVVGAAYGSARTITAAYALHGSRLILGSVRVDGRAIAGAVDLTGAALSGCRMGA